MLAAFPADSPSDLPDDVPGPFFHAMKRMQLQSRPDSARELVYIKSIHIYIRCCASCTLPLAYTCHMHAFRTKTASVTTGARMLLSIRMRNGMIYGMCTVSKPFSQCTTSRRVAMRFLSLPIASSSIGWRKNVMPRIGITKTQYHMDTE